MSPRTTPVRNVAVLKGGWSTEQDVSLRSGAAAGEALREAGYNVTEITVRRDPVHLVGELQAARPHVVFNALHGRFGEDGCIQGLLDILELPYTHSGLLASSLAMDKAYARRIFAQAGIPVAPGLTVTRDQLLAGDPLPRPYVVKPINEGSSVGVHILKQGGNALPFDAQSWPYGEQVLVEAFIPGRELTAAVMGDRALGCLEITSDRGFYDYEAKYAPGGSRHIMPAPLPAEIYEEACRLALSAHQVLGCRGVSRTDLRYDETAVAEGRGNGLYVLEVNTQPGMTATSLVPEIAAFAGISFPQLVSWMVENATCDA